jgi:hypothetical protein
LKYTSAYLTEQLNEAREVSADLNARAKADPDDFALFLSTRSMNEHVEEIQADLETVKNEEAKSTRFDKIKKSGIAATAG